MVVRASTLADLPLCAARRFANRIALHASDLTFSFADIERLVAAVAGGLAQRGVKYGDRVVPHLPNTWRWIGSYYAISRIGAVIVPANILLVTEEIQFIAEDCNARAIIGPGKRTDELHAIGRPASPRLYIAVHAHATNAFDWDELLQSLPVGEPTSVESFSILTIGYISGTTGRAKGAVLSHRNVTINTAMTANMHVRTSADTVVTALPCSHVYGDIVMNGAFLCGYTLVLLERFDADVALEVVERHRATLLG